MLLWLMAHERFSTQHNYAYEGVGEQDGTERKAGKPMVHFTTTLLTSEVVRDLCVLWRGAFACFWYIVRYLFQLSIFAPPTALIFLT